MTCHCVANPVPVVRYSGRAHRMSSFAPLSPPKKIRFNHPALPRVLTMMMKKIIIIIIIIIIKVTPVMIGTTGTISFR